MTNILLFFCDVGCLKIGFTKASLFWKANTIKDSPDVSRIPDALLQLLELVISLRALWQNSIKQRRLLNVKRASQWEPLTDTGSQKKTLQWRSLNTPDQIHLVTVHCLPGFVIPCSCSYFDNKFDSPLVSGMVKKWIKSKWVKTTS